MGATTDIIRLGIEVELYCKCKPRMGAVLGAIGWEESYDPSIRTTGESRFVNSKQVEFRTSSSYIIHLEDLKIHLDKMKSDFQKIMDHITAVDVNESQGIHFHVSGLKRKTNLFSKSGFDFVHEAYRRFASTRLEKRRLGGFRNSFTGRDTAFFCKWQYNEEAGHDRYYAINYKPSWGKHKTIEFRFFPSTKSPAVFRNYCKFILDIVKYFEERTIPFERHIARDDSNENEDININQFCC